MFSGMKAFVLAVSVPFIKNTDHKFQIFMINSWHRDQLPLHTYRSRSGKPNFLLWNTFSFGPFLWPLQTLCLRQQTCTKVHNINTLLLSHYCPTEADGIRKCRKEANIKLNTANTSANMINEQDIKCVCICTRLAKQWRNIYH